MIELLVILDAPQILCSARPYLVWQIFQHFVALTFASFTIFSCFFYPYCSHLLFKELVNDNENHNYCRHDHQVKIYETVL